MTTTTTTAGRPATFSRDEAIRRAVDLFWREGYLGVTTRELASAMNIQRSSFYNSFGDKALVFGEALDAYSRIAPDAALDDIAAGEPVIPAIVTTLRELCHVRAADKQARGCLVCNSVAELVGVDEETGTKLLAVMQRRIELMTGLFRQAVDQNEFGPVSDVDDIGRSFVSFLLGINVASKAIRSEEYLWSICRTFLLGIGVDEKAVSQPVVVDCAL